jgi:nitroimidazol reductase NimA-like FMN-containing flavoprotein (pyridoxamine 5'-phosphate oxidase superfamily)
MSTSPSTLGEPTVGRPIMPKDYGVPETDEGLLPWSHASERLQRARNYWVATVRPNGRPHVVPIWGVWHDDRFYFDGSPETRHIRNLTANSAMSVHLEHGEDVVIIEGTASASAAPDQALAAALVQGFRVKYAPTYEPGPDQWDEGGLYVVQPRVVLAWTRFPQDVTRFVFAAE